MKVDKPGVRTACLRSGQSFCVVIWSEDMTRPERARAAKFLANIRDKIVAGQSLLRLEDEKLSTLDEIRDAAISEALRRSGGVRQEAAKMLGIHERTLRRHLARMRA